MVVCPDPIKALTCRYCRCHQFRGTARPEPPQRLLPLLLGAVAVDGGHGEALRKGKENVNLQN